MKMMTMNRFFIAFLVMWVPSLALAQTPSPVRINSLNTELSGTNTMSCGTALGTNEAIPIDSGSAVAGSYTQQVLCTDLRNAVNLEFYNPPSGSAPTANFSITLPAGYPNYYLAPAGALAGSNTIVFPTGTKDAIVRIVSSANISSVTFSGTSVQNAPSGLTQSVPVAWQYLTECTCWFRIQ